MYKLKSRQKVIDRNPDLKESGYHLKVQPDETTKNCLEFEQRPDTPENIKKWKRFDAEVGKTNLHPGFRGTYDNIQDKKFGKLIENSDHVDQCMPQLGVKGFSKLIHEKKEEIYHSSKNEPLGQARDMPMVYPDEVMQPEFKGFGVGVQYEESSKNLIYSCNSKFGESDYPKDLIKKRQLEGLEGKKDVRFGYIDKNSEYNGVSKTFEQYQSTYEKTNIIDLKDDRRKKLNREPIGFKKDPLQGTVDKDIKFGVSTGEQKEGWSSGQCIQGDYKLNERFSDVDLGKNRKYRQNVYNFGHNDGNEKLPDRAFGIPTIRTDIDKRGQKSVADPLNYGGEANAQELLHPKEYVYYNIVGEELFHKKQELFEVFKYFKDTGVDVKQYTSQIIEYSKLKGQHNKFSIKLVLDFLEDMNLIKGKK